MKPNDIVPTYRLLHDVVHEYVFHDNSNAAVDAYLSIWYQTMPQYWRDHPAFDGLLRLMLDMRHSGPINFGYAAQASIQRLEGIDDLPPWRVAYIITPTRAFITQVQTYAALADRGRLVQRRFFLGEERETALRWLIDGKTDTDS